MHAQFALTVLVFAGLPGPVAGQPAASPQQAWGAATGALRMSIAAAEAGGGNAGVELRIAVQNVSPKDLVLNLGMMLANGSTLEPTAIGVQLTYPSGETREFPISRLGAIAGRIDDFIVGLPAGSTYVLTRTMERTPAGPWRPGRYRVTSRFEGKGPTFINLDTPGMRLVRFWTETVQSNTADFEVKH